MSHVDTNQKGDIAEAKSVARFMELGYVVSEPINDHPRYDLVVEKNNTLYKIQVKYASMDTDGRIYVSIASSNPNTKGSTEHKYSSSEVDAYSVYCPETRSVYWIDYKDASKNNMYLRVEAEINHPSINWADDYEI